MNLLRGLQDIADDYDTFILDIFGVLHDGLKPFPGTIECLQQLHEKNKAVCLLSNSPRRSDAVIEQAAAIGIPKTLMKHAVTSGEATFQSLDTHIKNYGPKCWFPGKDVHLKFLFEGFDAEILEGPDNADFILNTVLGTDKIDGTPLKDQLDVALSQNIPMICANPDLVVHIGDQLHECAGTFAKYYEDHGGEVIYYGKPHAPVYDMALEKLGHPEKSRIIAIGDSLHTDIQGANRYGIDSVFNMTGIHWEELQPDHAPDAPHLDKLTDFIDSQAHRPTYGIAGFNWNPFSGDTHFF